MTLNRDAAKTGTKLADDDRCTRRKQAGLSGYVSLYSDRSDVDQSDVRRRTFLLWPCWAPRSVDPVQLADAGLFFTGDDDAVRCYGCRDTFSGWREGDVPLDVHRRRRPTCPVVVALDRRRRDLAASSPSGSSSRPGPAAAVKLDRADDDVDGELTVYSEPSLSSSRSRLGPDSSSALDLAASVSSRPCSSAAVKLATDDVQVDGQLTCKTDVEDCVDVDTTPVNHITRSPGTGPTTTSSHKLGINLLRYRVLLSINRTGPINAPPRPIVS